MPDQGVLRDSKSLHFLVCKSDHSSIKKKKTFRLNLKIYVELANIYTGSLQHRLWLARLIRISSYLLLYLEHLTIECLQVILGPTYDTDQYFHPIDPFSLHPHCNTNSALWVLCRISIPVLVEQGSGRCLMRPTALSH